jgi:hypothetical protein
MTLDAAAGHLDNVNSKHRAARLNLVSKIELYTANSGYIDAILVWFVNGHVERLGTPDGESMGSQVASVTFAPDDRVTELYVWTDSSAVRVQGVAMKLASGARLDGDQGRRATEAQLQLDEPGALGSGLLLGLAAAAKPDSKVLSAIGFSFLSSPMSAALAVLMPEIRIEEVRFTPKVDVAYTFSNTNAGTVRGACPAVTKTTVTTTAYPRAGDAQRLKGIVDRIGGPDDVLISARQEAALVASKERVLESGEVVTNTWRSEVRGPKQCSDCTRSRRLRSHT